MPLSRGNKKPKEGYVTKSDSKPSMDKPKSKPAKTSTKSLKNTAAEIRAMRMRLQAGVGPQKGKFRGLDSLKKDSGDKSKTVSKRQPLKGGRRMPSRGR
jgi:hypothetical protein